MKKKKSASQKKELYVIAGPNGAGKTTFAREFLPHYVRCLEFVNADYIASGISPFAPEIAAIDAGRLMVKRISELIEEKKSFGFETTLAGRGYAKTFQKLKRKGYRIHLYFLWLPSASVAMERVAQRVRKGGHDIPEDVVKRRFQAGLQNFFKIYRSLVDEWILCDATKNPVETIATGTDENLQVSNQSKYDSILAGVNS